MYGFQIKNLIQNHDTVSDLSRVLLLQFRESYKIRWMIYNVYTAMHATAWEWKQNCSM